MRVGKLPVYLTSAAVATPEDATFDLMYRLSTDGVVYGKKSDGTIYPIGGSAYNIKGDLDCSANPNYPVADKGDAYRVPVGGAGKVGGGAGKNVQEGDIIVAWVANAGGTEAAVGSSWTVEQGNLEKASSAEAVAGTDDAKYVTPLTLAKALQLSQGNYAAQSNASVNDIVSATNPVQGTNIPQNGYVITLRKTAFVNTGAMTLDIGGGALNIVKQSKSGVEIALVAGDMPPGFYVLVHSTVGGAHWILINPMIPDIDITGNAASATNAALKPRYVTFGGSALGTRMSVYQSDTTTASANNPAVAGGAGAFSVIVPDLIDAAQMMIVAYPDGADATNPTMAIDLAFDSATGTISGTALTWDQAGGDWDVCADGTRVQVSFVGVQV